MTNINTQIETLYHQGKTSQQIGDEIGLTLNQVNRIVYKELGLQSKVKKVMSSEIKMASELKAKNFNRSLICDRMGIDRGRLKRILLYAK